MSTEVGERAGPAPPRRPLGPDCVRLGVLLAVAVAVHAWLVAHTAVPARDGLAYARIANNLRDPNAGAEPGRARSRLDVIRTAEHPPGFPLAVCAAEAVLRRVSDLPHPDRMLLATQLANAAAAVLLVVPLYLIGRMLFGRDVGFASALLFQVLPVPARVTSDGLSEGLYLLAAAVAVCLAVRAARRPGVVGYFLCGAAAGASYLVRPEGLLVAVGVGAVVGWGGLTRRTSRGLALGRLAALLAGLSLVAGPYVGLIGKLTNKPTGSYLANPLDDRPAKIWLENPGARAPAVGAAAPFAVWRNPLGEHGENRETWALRAVGAELLKSTHYVVGALAVFGLIVHRRRLSDPGLGTLVVLGLLSLGLMVYLAARIGYVSERHTLLFVMLACVLAAAALEPFARAAGLLPVFGRAIIWPAAAPGGFLVVLVAAALPFTLKPMHAQREGHKHAGRWISAHAREGDRVKDPLGWGEWYAGRTPTTIPAPGVRAGSSVWVVVERGKKGPHSLLPLWAEANALVAGRTPAYRWPEAGPHPGPVVEVYRLELADLAGPRAGGQQSAAP